MNSPGHRANILSPEFGRVVLGLRMGVCMKEFTQEFADKRVAAWGYVIRGVLP